MDVAVIEFDKKTQAILNRVSKKRKIKINEFIKQALYDYLDRYIETEEILSDPKIRRMVKQGKKEVKNNIKGILIDELED